LSSWTVTLELQLVRGEPEELVGGDPAWMLGRRVPLQVPRPKDPMAAALDRAGPLQPRLPRDVVGEELCRAGLASGLAAGAHQHREQALTWWYAPVEVPQKNQRGPTPHPHSNVCSASIAEQAEPSCTTPDLLWLAR
jgi:hypothetical protein